MATASSSKIALTGIGLLTAGLIISISTDIEPMNLPASVNNGEIDLPSKVKVEVPFTSQAPHANWDAPYQEACEEAALIMAHYENIEKDLNPEVADKEIVDLINWSSERGYAEDITLAQLAEIAHKYYGYQTRIVDNPSVDDIKKLISEGFPVIVPAAGRELGNPYFTGEGPWYHMLVITGYDRRHFITNDPGTRRGEGYKYKYSFLMAAIHDWNGKKEEITGGQKRVMIIE